MARVGFSAAVEAARARRASRAAEKMIRIDWFINQVSQTVRMDLKKRVRLATTFLMSQVVVNLSIPVTKVVLLSRTIVGGKVKWQERVRVTERSKPGEFPRADTTTLMKSIFMDVQQISEGGFVGYVGTPLDYGLELELLKNRSFLVRSLNENRLAIVRLLTGPIT